jgi:uncharacterized protein DUF6629
VCFSAQADAVAGIAVVAIGLDSCRHVRHPKERLLAALPLVLGAHQLMEVFVWWDLQGHVYHEVGRLALWAYLLVAFVVLPVYVPLAVVLIEPTRRRRWMAPFLALGGLISVVLLSTMAQGAINAMLRPWHLSYGIGLNHAVLVVMLYVTAICGPLLFSGYRHVAIFGIGNLVVVITLAVLTADGFASLWCVYAALSAAAIALHLRFAKAHRVAGPVPT